MDKKTEALKLALEALERLKRAFFKNAPDCIEEWESEWVVPAMNAITSIREALAEQPAQQEPVKACVTGKCPCKSECDIAQHCLYTSPPASKPLPPVDGDLLPPVGSQVLIHLASQDQWVAHTVVGYYVWGAFDSDQLHRVFVRVKDSDGILNARRLCDVRSIEAAHGIKGDA